MHFRILMGVAVVIALMTGCSHMSSTRQRALSGGAIGAGSGAALAAITGGSVLAGTAIGAGVGTIGGLIYDDTRRRKCRLHLTNGKGSTGGTPGKSRQREH
jgi:osmotically inducible lipoprotein OsmB